MNPTAVTNAVETAIKPGGFYAVSIIEGVMIVLICFATYRAISSLFRTLYKEHEAHREEVKALVAEQEQAIFTIIKDHREHIREVLDRYERYMERLVDRK